MITWRAYLQMLREDGVDLVESEEAAITDDGERVVAYTLVRWVEGRLLQYVIPT